MQCIPIITFVKNHKSLCIVSFVQAWTNCACMTHEACMSVHDSWRDELQTQSKNIGHVGNTLHASSSVESVLGGRRQSLVGKICDTDRRVLREEWMCGATWYMMTLIVTVETLCPLSASHLDWQAVDGVVELHLHSTGDGRCGRECRHDNRLSWRRPGELVKWWLRCNDAEASCK